MSRHVALLLAALAGGCATELARATPDAGADEPDPLDIPIAPGPGALAALQRTVFSPICAAIPGQCHAGQFEPNLSTMAQSYHNLVNKAAIEHPHQYRVDAEADPAESHIIHKLRGSDGVQTIMPLGSAGLPEEQIAAVESWIAGGARWDDEADAPPRPNNPPEPPLIQEWSPDGERLDEAGPFAVAVGDTIVFRASTRDLETVDAEIPAFAFVLAAGGAGGQGRGNVVLSEDRESPQLGFADYDDQDAPELAGERYNRVYRWTVPATVDLVRDDGGGEDDVPAPGLVLTVIGVYLDGPLPDEDTMVAFALEPGEITVEEAE